MVRTDTTPPAAEARNFTRVYGTGGNRVAAVDGISLQLPARTFTAVMGPSGSGKSTLMHMLAGLEQPTSGQAWLGGREITGMDDDGLTRLRRRHVGFVFQAFNLMPTLDVRQNIVLPFDLDGRTPSAAENQHIDQLIQRLGLPERVGHLPGQLSGGQQQRVALARALATGPELVLADEPTGNLDSRSATEVLDLLATAAEELGQATVMVTHDPTAASYASRVVYLADGHVTETVERQCTPEEIAATMLSLEGRK